MDHKSLETSGNPYANIIYCPQSDRYSITDLKHKDFATLEQATAYRDAANYQPKRKKERPND
jgi:hypothetical protein